MKKVLENKEIMVLYCYSNLNKRGQTDGVYYLTCRSTRLQIGVYLLYLKRVKHVSMPHLTIQGNFYQSNLMLQVIIVNKYEHDD